MSQAASSADAAAGVDSPRPRRRRLAELFLLFLALVIGLGSYVVSELGHSGQLPDQLLLHGAGLTLLAAAVHVVIWFRAPYADPVILPCVVVINGLGLTMIHRLDVLRDTDNAPTQLLFTVTGATLMAIFLLILRDYRHLQRVTYTSGLIGVVLLALPLVPGLGVSFQGSVRWISVLGLFNLQPSEPAKLCLIVFFAGYLVVKRDALALAGRRILGIDLPRGRDLGPILVGWAISLCILIYSRDLGSSLLFFGTFVVLLYISTERPSWLVLGTLLFTGGAVLALTTFSYVQDRVQSWLDPFADPEGTSFQIVRSLHGLAYGGMLGQGLGEGRPDLTPVAHSDFLPAAIGEELGLTGFMALIVVYGILIERGLRTALICKDSFGKLLAAGFAVMIGLQTFIGIGGVTKLIPMSGLTTPFLSYGGSSLVVNWLLIALLLRISHHARRPESDMPTVPTEDAMTQVVSRR